MCRYEVNIIKFVAFMKLILLNSCAFMMLILLNFFVCLYEVINSSEFLSVFRLCFCRHRRILLCLRMSGAMSFKKVEDKMNGHVLKEVMLVHLVSW